MGSDNQSRFPLILGRTLVVLSLAGACWLLHGLMASERLPERVEAQIRQVVTSAKILTYRDYGALIKDSREYQAVREEMEYYRNVADPGPPPSMLLHPIEYWKWRNLHKVYSEAKVMLETLQHKKQRIEERTNGLVKYPKKIELLSSYISPFALFWNQWIAPFLHLLLFLTLMRFGLRILLRMLIISGRLPKAKV